MSDLERTQPFDIERESLYCARCGRKCVPVGHLTGRFLMCPVHGEFTIAPVVMQHEDGWRIHHRDDQARAMWETCRYVDEPGTGDDA